VASEQERRNRTQARVGLASNVIGLGAGTAGLVSAAKDRALRAKVGETITEAPRKISRRTKALAGGALALQVENLGGDVVANRVLARNAKVEKADQQSITDIFISKSAHGTGIGKAMPDSEYDREVERARKKVRPQLIAANAIGTGLVGAAGGKAVHSAREINALTGSEMNALKKLPKAGRFIAGGAVLGGSAGALGGARAWKRTERKLKTDPVLRARGEAAIMRRRHYEDVLRRAAEAHAREQGAVGKAYRRYDPEADRQRRLGLYAGLGALGAGVAGQEAARTMTTRVSGEGGESLRGLAFKRGKGKKGALLSAAALASGAGGAAAYRKGISERNNPWN
jgi:hypothetical protein